MQVRFLTIKNFRGIKHAELMLPNHAVLIGDNNTGKTTILEALDLVLGPERLNRFPPVDEHDFYQGIYIKKKVEDEEPEDDDAEIDVEDEADDGVDGVEEGGDEEDVVDEDDEGDKEEVDQSTEIRIEACVIDLSDDQKTRFGDYLEWWDQNANQLYTEPNPEGVDAEHIAAVLRVTFIGSYDAEEDDFVGQTYFTRTFNELPQPKRFSRRDKQLCGFLYLRSLRTGRRALSLERGSLLDIILRLKEIRPQMWEDTLAELSAFTVAAKEDETFE